MVTGNYHERHTGEMRICETTERPGGGGGGGLLHLS